MPNAEDCQIRFPALVLTPSGQKREEKETTCCIFRCLCMAHKLTYAVNMIATDATQPPIWLLYPWPSCGQTAAAKKTTGTTIKPTVSTSDLTSGPKISLPPRKNICKKAQIKSMIDFCGTLRKMYVLELKKLHNISDWN